MVAATSHAPLTGIVIMFELTGDYEIILPVMVACILAKAAGADFVKTSTGFSTGGATAGDVALMAEVVRGAGMEVKASGGISSYEDAKAMIEAGATRLGASASIGIVREAKATSVSA